MNFDSFLLKFIPPRLAHFAPQVHHGPPPWLVFRDAPWESSLRVHEELIDFAGFMRPTVIEVAMRDAWVHSIADAAGSLWPMVQVHIFGSTSTSLNLPTADIDVAIVRLDLHVSRRCRAYNYCMHIHTYIFIYYYHI